MLSEDVLAVMPEARYALNQRRQTSAHPELWQLLDRVKDPEIPVLSIWELGVLQQVEQVGARVRVTLTPTYSGCPALTAMVEDVQHVLHAAGHSEVEVVTQLAPAWTTEWLAPATRQKLRDYGVSSPEALRCPQCGSAQTELISEFASTACKSLHRCKVCLEPFDHFKAL